MRRSIRRVDGRFQDGEMIGECLLCMLKMIEKTSSSDVFGGGRDVKWYVGLIKRGSVVRTLTAARDGPGRYGSVVVGGSVMRGKCTHPA
jgi:hypothetical protein